MLIFSSIRIYDRKKPPFLFLTKDEDHHMNMHYTFSVREVSEVRDNEQVLKVRKKEKKLPIKEQSTR